MDELSVAILGGVVVTLFGALLAFYFGGVREKQKQRYEQQRDEVKQQEEQEEELNKRRAEVLTKIQAQAAVIVEGVRSFGKSAADLPESLPDTNSFFINRHKITRQVRELLEKYSKVVQQRDAIAERNRSLRRYYLEQKPFLPANSRNLVERFNRDFDIRYTPVSSLLPDYDTFRRRCGVKEDLSTGKKILFTSAAEILTGNILFGRIDPTNMETMWSLPLEWEGLLEAARYAEKWNFRSYRVAFEKDIERLTGSS